MYVCMHACMYVCVHTDMHACMPACMRMFVRKYIHIYLYSFGRPSPGSPARLGPAGGGLPHTPGPRSLGPAALDHPGAAGGSVFGICSEGLGGSVFFFLERSGGFSFMLGYRHLMFSVGVLLGKQHCEDTFVARWQRASHETCFSGWFMGK